MMSNNIIDLVDCGKRCRKKSAMEMATARVAEKCLMNLAAYAVPLAECHLFCVLKSFRNCRIFRK